ncbi:PAS domain-containing hybrid sensor histidine kinase/response regulator [Alishewanella sp. d11]|uniref:PAS domain-containing hybrid sensor histidine kinase/response regulator n=1 Tax=Alishewanella sp. d11 TaxID=3414030 RepID=UPI003BF9041A
MQCYDFSSTRFISSFPQCADGSFVVKYQQLLNELFVDCDVFILLVNHEGDCFSYCQSTRYKFEQPGVLLHLLTDGASTLVANSLQQKPYQGIFNDANEAHTKFFVCSAIKAVSGPLLGAFGVISQRHKSLLPDEKIFLQWLAESLADDIQVDNRFDAADHANADSLAGLIIPYLDDIYIMVDCDGVLISLAAQLPRHITESINTRGGTLASTFGESHQVFFKDLIELTASTAKKQTNVLTLNLGQNVYMFSVSCNLFSAGWYLLTFRDVTEHHRMRALLETRTKLLEGIIQVGNVGIILLNELGQVLYSNEQANSWFAINTDDKVNFMPALHWQSHTNSKTPISPFQKFFTTTENIIDEHYCFHAGDKRERIVSISASLLPEPKNALAQATFYVKDVTERAKLEQAMLAMDQQMQFLLQSSPVIIYQLMFLPQPVLTYISPNVESILGYSAESLFAKEEGFLGLVHPEDISLVKDSEQDAFDGMLEYRLKIAGSKQYHWFKDVRQSISDSEQFGVIGALLDITERKEKEQQLAVAQQRFQQLIKHVPGMIYQFQLNPDGSSCFPFASDGIELIYGVTPDQVRDDATAAFQTLHPDDYDKVSQSIVSSAEFLQQWHCRYRAMNLNNEYQWLEGIATPIKLANGSILWHGYIRDITEQQLVELKNQQLQHELSATLDSMMDAVLSIDRHGRIISLNPAATKLFGYTHQELLGNNIAMLMPDDIASQHDGFINAYQITGDAKIIGIGREVLGRHKDGHEIPLAISISEVGEGELKRFVGCCHDLTAFKKQQEQLLHNEKLSAIGKLTSSLAHDFNNILGIIRGYAEMLQQQEQSIASLVNPIIDASDRASAMINQLLDFSSAKQRPMQQINVFTHLQELQPLLAKALSENIQFVLTQSNRNLWIDVELPAFDNALLNIVVNANFVLKEQAGACFEITIQNVSLSHNEPNIRLQAGEYVKIDLTDNGCGMSDEVKAKIFEPFFTTKGAQGTGLGLAQTYGMVQRCRGAIKVTSTLGEGTTFSIFLPRVAVTNATNLVSYKTVSEITAPVSVVNSKASDSARILVVDDEADLLEMHAMLLESAGYEIYKAASANEALNIAQTTAIDLLLSDIVMPKVNGFELAKSLKASYPEIKVQLISGFADKSMISDEQCLHWYEQRLVKPVAMAALLKRIKQVLS